MKFDEVVDVVVGSILSLFTIAALVISLLN